MHRLALGWLLLGLVLYGGCRPPETQKATELKPWFEQNMANVSTEDGAIDMSSVHQVGEDTLEYQTVKNGVRTTWRQQFRRIGPTDFERVGDPKDITAEMKQDGSNKMQN